MPEYKFRDGVRLPTTIKPDVAAVELLRIAGNNGRIEAEQVVEESRPDTAPLHEVFTWDDQLAAHEHRLSQARSLIRAVVIVQDSGQRDPMFVHVRVNKTEHDYRTVEIVKNDPDVYLLALKELLEKLRGAWGAVEQLKVAVGDSSLPPEEFEPVSEAITALERARDLVDALA